MPNQQNLLTKRTLDHNLPHFLFIFLELFKEIKKMSYIWHIFVSSYGLFFVLDEWIFSDLDLGSFDHLKIHCRFSPIGVATLHCQHHGMNKIVLRSFWKKNEKLVCKDVHIVVRFAYLLSSYSNFEWAENLVVQARTKKLSGKQICCMTKWFLWKLDNLSHL